ncbi:hypothetical protein ACLKA7_005239, partial [Drosophila subpalustris]
MLKGEEQLLASSSQLNRERVVAEAPAAGLPSGSRSAKSAAPLKSVGQAIEKMKAISNGVLKSALDEGVSASLLCDLMDRTSAYETLLFSLVAENERLRGRLEVLSERASHGRAQQVPVPPAAARKGGPESTVSSTPEIPRPVETWSLVVRSKTAGKTAKDVVEQVVKEASGYLNRTRGDMLAEWAVSQDVRVVNMPSEWYTFDGPMGKSDIDVTFVNEAAMRMFDFSWNVLGGYGISDHNPIEVCVTHTSTMNESVGGNRWRTRGANWSMHGMFVREEATQVDLGSFRALSVDEQVVLVNRWMTSANDRMFERHRKVNLKRVKWWTRELTLKRRSVRTLRKRFQRARSSGAEGAAQLGIEYRRCMNEYKQMLVSVKEDEWRSFLERNKHDPWGIAYKIVRGRGRECDVCSLSVDGVQLTTWRDCMNVLLNGFFPRAGQGQLSPSVAVAADPLREGELGLAFSMLKSRKSPGMDGFTGEMCKSVWNSIPEYMKELYERCVSEGYFPNEWKNAKVIVLLKSPDRIRSNPRSFRGISLLPVLGKV